MKKIYLIIGLLILSATSKTKAQDKNKEENIFGMYFRYTISNEGRYNFNACRNKINGYIDLTELNPDSSFSSRVFSLSEICTFNAGRCDTTYGVFNYLGENIIVLNTDMEDTKRKIGSRDCNHFSKVKLYLFKNKFSDFINDEFAYNGFSNHDKVIKREQDKKDTLDLRTFYKKVFTDLNETYIKLEPLYRGVYYKFEVDKTKEGKIGVFKLLKLNEDKTFEYKFFQIYTNKVLQLDSTTYLKGNYEYISKDIIKLTFQE